jgi:hypothetical protein
MTFWAISDGQYLLSMCRQRKEMSLQMRLCSRNEKPCLLWLLSQKTMMLQVQFRKTAR